MATAGKVIKCKGPCLLPLCVSICLSFSPRVGSNFGRKRLDARRSAGNFLGELLDFGFWIDDRGQHLFYPLLPIEMLPEILSNVK